MSIAGSPVVSRRESLGNAAELETIVVSKKTFVQLNPSMWVSQICSESLENPKLSTTAQKVGAMFGYILACVITGGLFFALDYAVNGQPAVKEKLERKLEKEGKSLIALNENKNELENEKAELEAADEDKKDQPAIAAVNTKVIENARLIQEKEHAIQLTTKEQAEAKALLEEGRQVKAVGAPVSSDDESEE